MWHFDNIPKKMHCYWGRSRPLSYLRFLTVKSFSQLNPDWEIIVYTDQDTEYVPQSWQSTSFEKEDTYKGKDWFPELEKVEGTEIVEVDFSDTPVANKHDVFKSDFLRWRLLRDQGGLWSDFDIVYFKPIHYLPENKVHNRGMETILCKYDWLGKYAIGFIMASPNNLLMDRVCNLFDKYFDETRFQSGGNELLQQATSTKRRFSNFSLMLHEKCVYPLLYNSLHKLGDMSERWSESIGFHWYGGAKIMVSAENTVRETDNILVGDIELNLRNALVEAQKPCSLYL